MMQAAVPLQGLQVKACLLQPGVSLSCLLQGGARHFSAKRMLRNLSDAPLHPLPAGSAKV